MLSIYILGLLCVNIAETKESEPKTYLEKASEPTYTSGKSPLWQKGEKVVKFITHLSMNEDDYFADRHCKLCKRKFMDIERATALPCNQKHIFHRKCVIAHLQRKDKCPSCESEAPQDLVKAARDPDYRDFSSFADKYHNAAYGVRV
jgi:hypothetical protein